MHGRTVDVEAKVASIQGLSSHADADEIMAWIKTADQPPGRVFVVHGEEKSSRALATRIIAETGAPATIPDLGDSFDL
jgi:metallo-beta-lactamase family protein